MTDDRLSWPVRRQTRKGPLNEVRKFSARRTAFLIMDAWDRHWCADVNTRSTPVIQRIEAAADRLREQGVHILHVPSDCAAAYEDHPARERVRALRPVFTTPLVWYGVPFFRRLYGDPPVQLAEENGCPCRPHCEIRPVWTRQHSGISIHDGDALADDPKEIVTYLRRKGIRHIVYAGFHANICLLRRPAGIAKMSWLGYDCLLARDLTDIMYDPALPPNVDHEEARIRVFDWIERKFCATTGA